MYIYDRISTIDEFKRLLGRNLQWRTRFDHYHCHYHTQWWIREDVMRLILPTKRNLDNSLFTNIVAKRRIYRGEHIVRPLFLFALDFGFTKISSLTSQQWDVEINVKKDRKKRKKRYSILQCIIDVSIVHGETSAWLLNVETETDLGIKVWITLCLYYCKYNEA